MFQKLISNLPFNPSLISQVSFYTKRMHRESAIRRSGLVVMILAIAVQIFAVASPPQATASRSNNDVIKGGIQSRNEAVAICQQGQSSRVPDFVVILKAYGITCDDLAHTTTQKVSSTGSIGGGRLYSLGRIAYGPTGKKGQPSNEQKVNIPGSSTSLYMRLLNRWDSGASSTYTMLVGRTGTGMPFAIMYDCGNLVVDQPQPPKKVVDKPIEEKPKTPKCPLDSRYAVNDERCKQCPYNSSIIATNPMCKVCDKSADSTDTTACLTLNKAARNETQGIADANNTTAKPNDVIVYTLNTTNTAKVTIKAFVVEENVNDILDYAAVIDTHGGNLTDDGIIRWPAKDIPAGGTLTQTLTIKVKPTIPQTPASSSNPGTYDMIMTNVYGNVINIKLQADVVKTVEVVTKELPNTGPGTSVAIGFGLTVIVAYFFARSRLMGKELDIVKNEQTAGGL